MAGHPSAPQMRNAVRYVTKEQFDSILDIAGKSQLSPWARLTLRVLWATGCRPSEIVGSKFKPGREEEEGLGPRISRRKEHHGIRAMDVLPNHRIHVAGKHTSPRGRTLALKERVVLCADSAVWDELRALSGRAAARDANLILPRSRHGVGALDAQIRKLRPSLPPELSDFSPRWLRHSHAIHSLRNGVDLVSVQRQLGHESLTTTAIYLRFAGIEEERYLSAFTAGDGGEGWEQRDCPSCGFAWRVSLENSAMDLTSRMGIAFRR